MFKPSPNIESINKIVKNLVYLIYRNIMLFLNGKLVKYILLNIDVKQKTKQKQNKCYCPNVGHVIIE